MDHLKNENCLVLEQKVLFDRSWKLKLLSAHSEFLIDGLGHKPSNSEFSTNFFFHKMTRDQVIHHV